VVAFVSSQRNYPVFASFWFLYLPSVDGSGWKSWRQFRLANPRLPIELGARRDLCQR
jgi:hypothetical protein